MADQALLARRRKAAALASLVMGLLLLAAKWAAYWMTGSHAILSDALESIVNVAASGFAVLSIWLSARPPDPKYPYGYGKVAYFSAGFEGGLITLAAFAIVYEAVQGLVYGQSLRELNHGIAILLVTALANLALGLMLLRVGRATSSLVLVADGWHVLTDAYTSLGVIVGIALVLLTGQNWLDSLAAILVALNILRTGYHLVREAVRGLMDRADPAVLARVVAALQAARRPGWIDLHHLRAWQAGDRSFVDFHLVVPAHWTVGQVHEAHEHARHTIVAVLGEPTEIIVHFDPAPETPGRRLKERPFTVRDAVRVPAAGELGSEDTSPSEEADALASP